MHSAVTPPPVGAVEFTAKVPGDTAAVSTYYKRNVYDAADEKIGEVTDLIMGYDGRISTAVIAVGGFLGIGEKEVAVPFGSLHVKKKDNSWYLVMHTTKDALTKAPKFAYSGERAHW
jgi:sporulation protein YlmC with PRC-barrel domain